MYRTLFDLAGWAILGWLPLILLPTWKGSRWLARSAIFPAYLAAIYVVGIIAVLATMGPGIMGEFGTADGVLRLLRSEGLALVAWIHILAFDQVVGILIYRDNMRHRFVPVPVQSVLLFLTLMFGPVGFLSYWLLRMTRRRSGRRAWGSAEPGRHAGEAEPAAAAAPAPTLFADVVPERSPVPAVLGLWRREPALVGLALLAFALTGVCLAVAAVNGGWLRPPEGRLLDAAKFELASGLYFLSLALLLPLAGLSARARRRWVATAVVVGLYFLGVETVQAARGLDPRFTAAGGVVDQAAGAVFGATAIATIVLFVALVARFFRDDVLPDNPSLRTGIRYGAAAVGLAFAVGVVMSVLQGRVLASGGNVMPVHAAGFHGIQAVPLVGLLLGWSALSGRARMTWTHVAGAGWLLVCAGFVWQAVSGEPTLAPGAGLAVVVGGGAAWALAAAVALRAYLGAPRTEPAAVHAALPVGAADPRVVASRPG